MKRLLLVGLLVVGGIGGLLLARNFFTSSHATMTVPGSMMPGEGMMGTHGNATTTSQQALQQQVQTLGPALREDTATNQIQYTTQQVTMIAIGAPPGHPGMYWQVDGRINPTVVIPAGATVHVIFANGDSDTSHAWELTSSGPPYPNMPMMSAGTAAQNALLMPLPASHGNQWYTEATTFPAPAPGTYYYICPVPGHAQQGMWGKFIVE